MPKRVSRVTVRIACAQLAARPLAHAREALTDILAAIAAAGEVSADFLVLPECSYPGYVLLTSDPYRSKAVPPAREAIARASEAARRARVNVVLGIARAGADGKLRNEALLLDRDGEIAGVYAKSHLWNFDRRWFAPGEALPVFDTDRGRVGIMICADGRVPEIARSLTKRGAWLIADPTAWVGNGRTYESIQNPQVEFVLRARAYENGVVIAAADKCGSESGAVHYAGRSMIVGQDGAVAALAPAAGPAFIVADVQRKGPQPKIAAVTASQSRRLSAPVRPNRLFDRGGAVTLGVYQAQLRGASAALRAEIHRSLKAQGADAIVDTNSTPARITAGLRALRGLRTSIIEGSAMLAPEPARAAALDGADLLVWARPPRIDRVLDVARTRAFENRVYVLLCASASDREPACLIGPDGSLLTRALAGVPNGFSCEVRAATARDKKIVWGTDAFADRKPEAYDLFL